MEIKKHNQQRQLGSKITYAFLVFFALADIMIWVVAANAISAKGANAAIHRIVRGSQASSAAALDGIKCFFAFGFLAK